MKSQMVRALAVSLLGVVGCKTITIDSVRGASVKADDEVKPVPAQVQTHIFNDWFKKGKEIAVSKTGYAPEAVVLTTKTEDEVYVPLSRIFNIYANEEGATVYVNDETVGVTPLKGVAICDDGKSIVTVKKQGWLEEKMSPNEHTATDIMFTLERDASGRHLIDIVPDQNGARMLASSIFSDSDVGEDSPNVAQVRRLTSQPQNEYIQDFSILPDGKSLVASILEVAEKEGKQLKRANLWLLNALVSAAPRRALTTGNFMDINATASSDGETLYFSSTRNGRFAIWSLNMKTMAGLKLITNANTADSSPAIDPEGKDLLYTAVLPGNANPTYLWSKPADGSGMPSQLREGYDAVWSPDGTKCLYVKGNKENNEADIWMIDANGGNPTQLTVDGADSNDVDPHWSPDGRKIVFASNRGQIKGRKNYDIWMMDADGANLTQLTTNGSCDDKPAFGPDGKTIYFRSNRGLVWDIWMMTLAQRPVGVSKGNRQDNRKDSVGKSTGPLPAGFLDGIK